MITIIPAIDVINGKCVRLTKGDYKTKKIYNDDPLEVAKMFEQAGIKRLHMVDLDGAKQNHIINGERYNLYSTILLHKHTINPLTIFIFNFMIFDYCFAENSPDCLMILSFCISYFCLSTCFSFQFP